MSHQPVQHPLIDQLRSAIRHALVLGLETPGALDPLTRLAEPLRAAGLTALGERIEEIRHLQGADESVYVRMMNELVRLWQVSQQILLRVQPVYRLPETVLKAPHSTDGGWLVLEPAPESPWVALLEGSAPLIVTVPRIQAEIERWQPGEPFQPILIGLSHSALTQIAGRRLHQLGAQAVPILLRLIRFRNQMVSIRAWEVLLDLYEEGLVSPEEITPHIDQCPLAMGLVRRLSHLNLPLPSPKARATPSRPSPAGIRGWVQRLRSDTPVPEEVTIRNALTETLQKGLSRSSLQEIVRRYGFYLMLLSEDDPLIGRLIDEIEALARSHTSRMNLLACVPHPRITHLLLNQPSADPWSLATHIEATLDYRLIPQLLKYRPAPSPSVLISVPEPEHFPGLEFDVFLKVIRVGDSLLIPLVWRDAPKELHHFGEVARYLAEAWRNETDKKKRAVARRILKEAGEDV